MTGRPRSAGSATVLPSASRSSASAAGAAPCSGTRFSPATRSSSSVAPPTGTAPSRTKTSVLTAARPSMARMVLRALMPDAGGVQRLADVEGREEELELGVFDGVGGQHVGPERRHAPLESLAHVPDLVAVRAPRRKMPRQPLGDVGQPAAPEELVRAALGRVAIGARVVA